MTVRTHSEAGSKVQNEDFVLAERHPGDPSIMICALADGQGGRSHGAEAARAACEAVREAAANLPAQQLFMDRTWIRIIQEADRKAAATGGFTTLIALAVSDDFAAGASCGDSKAFFRLAGHTELAEWTVHQRKNPPVGSECADPEPFMCHAIGGSRLLIVSDGVWKFCGYEALKTAFEIPPDQVAEHLKSAVLSRAGSSLPDDFSLITVDLA